MHSLSKEGIMKRRIAYRITSFVVLLVLAVGAVRIGEILGIAAVGGTSGVVVADGPIPDPPPDPTT
jgi:hypothetical protein